VIVVDIDQQSGKELARQHGVTGTPTLVFLDRQGRPVQVLRGAFPPAAVEQAVVDLLVADSIPTHR
jgi:thioredoxin-related protein